MHDYAIIIKPKKLDNIEAREIFGEILLNHSECDWYSTNANGCVFPNGCESIPIKEYLLLSDIDKGPVVPIIFLDHNGLDKNLIIPTYFWEFYDFPEDRAELLETYERVYRKQVKELLKEYKRKAYDVVLLDYHN